jgi:hypothetical protein
MKNDYERDSRDDAAEAAAFRKRPRTAAEVAAEAAEVAAAQARTARNDAEAEAWRLKIAARTPEQISADQERARIDLLQLIGFDELHVAQRQATLDAAESALAALPKKATSSKAVRARLAAMKEVESAKSLLAIANDSLARKQAGYTAKYGER